MKREFKRVVYRPKRIKLLFNYDVPNQSGDIVSMKDKSSLTRKDDNVLIEESKFWIAGPVSSEIDRDSLSRKIQNDLLNDESDFYICGSVDLTVHYEAEKEVLNEVVEYMKRHDANIGYFEETGNKLVNDLMVKLGFTSKRDFVVR